MTVAQIPADVAERILDECCTDCRQDVETYLAGDADTFWLCAWCAHRIRGLIVTTPRVGVRMLTGRGTLILDQLGRAVVPISDEDGGRRGD